MPHWEQSPSFQVTLVPCTVLCQAVRLLRSLPLMPCHCHQQGRPHQHSAANIRQCTRRLRQAHAPANERAKDLRSSRPSSGQQQAYTPLTMPAEVVA